MAFQQVGRQAGADRADGGEEVDLEGVLPPGVGDRAEPFEPRVEGAHIVDQHAEAAHHLHKR
ncbi:hypothetical protein HUT06_28795 [Actinomadura sp. NAK00032]|uniref:hypothetical protein n=1 Tax=Actinomadura sp. NAK00032 TaxID=2742128 RepID=UPI001591EA41|nr:hypothetical protein [Actinomadura sp. NAK00032]QKW37513.1 hypothetical protein HUT06_28795 [Actinomadura sp. NAK00032]